MSRLRLLALLPLLAQCQSEVVALRSEAFVPFSGTLQVWHNPGYTTDVLSFPDQGVECFALRELDSNNQPTGRWIVHSHSATLEETGPVEAVMVPGALAARIFALARASESQPQEERDLAEAAFAAELFRDMSELERALKIGRAATNSGKR